MKKSTIASLVVFLLVIPLTLVLFAGLSGRSHYLTSTLVIIESMVPFLMAFEGRRPQARELVVVAVMCAIAVVARTVVPVPHFKPMYAIIILSGISLGAETGFLVGAVTALASNFFFGQGAYTPWQMLAYGAAGMIAGLFFMKGWVIRKPVNMGIFGFLAVLLFIGPLLDTSSVLLMLSDISWKSAAALYISGFPANLSQAVCTFLTLFLLGEPMLEKLDRIKLKFGITGE